MGITKDYKRVELSAVLGLVGTGPNILYLKAGGKDAGLVAVGANERVIIWDLRTKELVRQLLGPASTVTSMARSPDQKTMAVGYRDGSVHIFDVSSGECEITFQGHKRAVTALAFDAAGMRLVSGSQDTDLTVWDLVSESGLFRLKGHTGEITKAVFMKEHNILVSSSKDKLVKFWDLDIQHCFKTLVGHRTEVYSFVLVNKGHRIITGSADSELRVWDITFRDEMDESETVEPSKKAKKDDSDDEDAEDDESSPLVCVSKGSVMREARDPVRGLVVDASEQHLLCHGPGRKCEVFVLASEEELQKKLKKRRKKARLRAAASGMEEEEVAEPTLTVEDEVRRVDTFKLSAKVKGVDVVAKDGLLQVATLLSNNCVETTQVQIVDAHNVSCQETSGINRSGHRSEVRTLAFSSDGNLFLSASGEQVKLWNRSSLQCISTFDCDYALCSSFAPGDKHVIIGTKSGKLQIFDVSSRTMTSCIDAHEDTVWSLSMAPKDKNGIITGSKDQTVKFWKFELVASPDDESGRKHLTLVHTRTLKMDDQVTCVTYSPDQRLLAVALLDNTVKVFFVDTLKLFHTLYGGSAPVLCMDISTDSTVIATGAADKNVKLWGLDFGDLKKSLYAHDDSVSCVKFIPRTHLFFSGGKDRLVKQWDADSYQHIITLKGHHAEVRALAVSPDGSFLVSSSHDMSLRLWEKTDGILVLDEEREQEREKEEEQEIIQSDEPVVAGEATTEVMAGRKTVDAVKGAESLIEAMDIYEEEIRKLAEHAAQCRCQGKQVPPPPPHPLMQAYKADSPAEFVLILLQKIRSSEIEETLLVLPFDYTTKLLKVLEVFLKNGWQTELSVRCVCFLLRIHQGQITSNQVLLPTLDSLRDLTKDRVKEFKDMVGYNLYAMQLLKIKVEEKQEDKLFADATSRFKQKKKKRKVHAPVVS
ncbi:WD repeat-containing protein 3-like [Littorina saxatilis]|uniref:Small-subunit processome Utp12 domain-containing protein n=1 Tax=Littorina saxatilis TaxID=31220 RepID=A0AAN9BNY3_9CAEN